MPVWFWIALVFDTVAVVGPTSVDEEIGLTHRQGVWRGETLTIVYHAYTNGVYQIYLRRWYSGRWEGAFRLTHTSADAKWPSIVQDAQDSLHIAWHDYRVDGIRNVEIYYTACTPSFSCLPEERITFTHSGSLGDNSYVPVLFRDWGDTLRMVWYDYRDDPQGARARIYYTARPPDHPWDTTSQIPLSDVSGNAWFPFIFRGRDTLFVVWADNAYGPYQIRLRRYIQNWADVIDRPAPSAWSQGYPHGLWAPWGEAILAFTEGGAIHVVSPGWGNMEVGQGDKPTGVVAGSWVWVVWHEDSAVVGKALDESGTVRDSFRMERPSRIAHPYAGVWPTITPGGRLFLVWSEDNGMGRDLVWAVSAGLAVAERDIAPVIPPTQWTVDVLGRKIATPRHPGWFWAGKGHVFLVIHPRDTVKIIQR